MKRVTDLWRRRWAESAEAVRAREFEAFADLGSPANRRLLLAVLSGLAVIGGSVGTLVMLPYSEQLRTPVVEMLAVGGCTLVLAGLAFLLPSRTPTMVLDAMILGMLGVITVSVSTGQGLVAGYTVLLFLWPMVPLVILRSSVATLAHFTVIGVVTAFLFGLDDTFDGNGLFWWFALTIAMALFWHAGGGMVRETRTLVWDERAARARAESMRDELEVVSRQKSDFLAAMSHELRTPLNAVLGFTELLRRGVSGPINDRQREYADDIAESGRHLMALIDDTLDEAAVERGAEHLDHVDTDLRDLIDSAVRMMRVRADNAGVALRVRAPSSVRAVVDQRKIRQVLVNLLSNAVKFTPAGGVIVVSVERCGPMAQIAVEDNGCGIEPAEQESIFEEFHQTGDPGTGGTGLGLTVSRRIVELHGGEIGVESSPQEGACFTFTLPRTHAPAPTDGSIPGRVRASIDSVGVDRGDVLSTDRIMRRGSLLAVYLLIACVGGALMVDTEGASVGFFWVSAAISAAMAIGSSLALRLFDGDRPLHLGIVFCMLAAIVVAVGMQVLGPLAPVAALAWAMIALAAGVIDLRLGTRFVYLYVAIVAVGTALALRATPGNIAPVAQWCAVVGTTIEVFVPFRWLVRHLQVVNEAETRATEEASTLAHELRALSLHKSKFLAGMSHELRSPLNGVLGFAEVLQMEIAGPLTDTQHENVIEIIESGRNLLALIDDVLDLAKVEAGRMGLDVDPVDLASMIDQAVTIARDVPDSDDVDLRVSVAADATFQADVQRITQVVSALVANAIEVTPAGQRVDVDAVRQGDWVRVTVADSGPAISRDDRAHVFEPFRKRRAAGEWSDGVGVGLALAQRFAALHGGRIAVESGRSGAVFTMRVPAEPADQPRPDHVLRPAPLTIS